MRTTMTTTIGRTRFSGDWRRPVDMPRRKPSHRLTITLDPVVHADVIAAADGVRVSAWMAEAARRALGSGDGLAGVADWEARHGRFTSEELDAARERLERRSRRG
jgi:hypothetical protein